MAGSNSINNKVPSFSTIGLAYSPILLYFTTSLIRHELLFDFIS